MANVQYRGTGRRKSSVARVILTPGTGNFVINGKEAREYLASDVLNMIVNQPLELTNTKDKFDVTVNVYGGGYSGQAGAIRHGVARALLQAGDDYRPFSFDCGSICHCCLSHLFFSPLFILTGDFKGFCL